VNFARSMNLALFIAALAPVWVCAGEAVADPGGPGTVFEDRASRTSVTFPGGYWRTLSRADRQKQMAGGCSGGGELPASYAWDGYHDDLPQVFVTCREVHRSFQVRNADELEALKTIALEAQGKAQGWTGVVESHAETQRDNMMLHRMAVKIARDERSRMIDVTNIFLRQADGDKSIVWYQLWCVAPDDVRADISSEFDAIVESFRYTNATLPLNEFYEPNASDEQVLTPDQIAESFTPSRGTPWLPIIVMIGVVVFFMRPRRKSEPVARK